MGPRRRRALSAVYAFARAVDDAVDNRGIDLHDPAGARAELAAWRTALTGGEIAEGIDRGVVRALEWALETFPINRRHLLDLVDGVARDLDNTRYESFEDLKVYCQGVAGTVGLACLPIFGLEETRHRDFAEKLGLAVQLVNILRDVKVDSIRDRFYLPAEDRRRFGYGDDELRGLIYNDNFRQLMAFQAQRAKDAFAAAEAALPAESRRAARPALIMGRLYQRLLKKLESRGFQVFSGPTKLTLREKILCAAGCG